MVVVNVNPRDATHRFVAKRQVGTVRQARLKPPVAPASKLAHDEHAGYSVDCAGENQTVSRSLQSADSATRKAELRRTVGHDSASQHDHTVTLFGLVKVVRA